MSTVRAFQYLKNIKNDLNLCFRTVRGLSEYVVKSGAVTFSQMLYFVTRSFFLVNKHFSIGCNCIQIYGFHNSYMCKVV